MHTAVFDIGKTNKKFSVFDENLAEIHREYTTLPESEDEDGFAGEDLALLTAWMHETLEKALLRSDFEITRLNFSTYGASFVHIDQKGQPVTPLYNYLKPFPEALQAEFYQLAGGKEDFCVRTASPALGMLNSGLQLYWLQQLRPRQFATIKYSLHLPQYCSYLFSGQPWSEFTSIGCHTGLWDFSRNGYHHWLTTSGIASKLPESVNAARKMSVMVHGRTIEVGVGMHDSSAALLPYLLNSREPFLLLSTGTWNITFNPFSTELLTQAELNQDCLNYMRLDGGPVKASRLFFGNEFNRQTSQLAEVFGKKGGHYHHTLTFDEELYRKWSVPMEPFFHLETMQYPDKAFFRLLRSSGDKFPNPEEAFYSLMIEMMRCQGAVGAPGWPLATPKGNRFVDGGFSQSDVFIHLLRRASGI